MGISRVKTIKSIDEKITAPGKPNRYQVTLIHVRENKFTYPTGYISEAEYQMWLFLNNSCLSQSQQERLLGIVEDYGQDQYDNGFQEAHG